MKHVDFLKGCSDKDIVQMIDEYMDLHQSGELGKTAMFRQLTEIVSNDYNSTYNLRFGEEVFTMEVLRRFKVRFEQAPKIKDV